MDKRTTIYLDQELHQRLKIFAVTTGKNLKDVIKEAIEKYLKLLDK